MDKKIIIVAAMAFVIGGGCGYGVGKIMPGGDGRPAQFAGQMGGQFDTSRTRANSGESFITGEVIASDDTSVTVKSRDGSSKIVLVGSSTQITKGAEGTRSDLTVGTNVTAVGTTNSDGSVLATTVSIVNNTMGAPSGQR